MGCDIHLYTEVLKSIDSTLTWVNCDNWKLDPYEPGRYRINEVWEGRDYELFAVLADVRNQHEITPISEPRGIPSDVSSVVQKESDRWNGDGHSHSWFTLLELTQYLAKNPGVKSGGLITLEDAALLDAGTLPTSWCQGSNRMENLTHRDWIRPFNSLKSLVKNLEDRCREELWIWGKEEISDENRAKIRIVFWFDN